MMQPEIRGWGPSRYLKGGSQNVLFDDWSAGSNCKENVSFSMNNVFSVFLGLFCLIVSDHFEHFPQKVYHLFYRCEVPWYISGTNLPEYSPFQSAWHFSGGCRAYFLSKFCFSKMSWSFHWFHLGQYRDFWNIVNFNSDKLSTLSDIDYFQRNVTKQWSLFSRQENAQIWYWLAGQAEQNYWGGGGSTRWLTRHCCHQDQLESQAGIEQTLRVAEQSQSDRSLSGSLCLLRPCRN